MLLEFKNVRKEYPVSNFSIKNINFRLNEGEVLGLIGRNGSGKSTILKLANKLVDLDEGDILYQSKSINNMNDTELRNLRRNIVYIFQEANLLENKSVYYHLSLVYKLQNKKVNEKEIDNILDFMDIKRLKNSYASHLSGGQKQKVAIAMALLQNPKVLLCDEISSALDTKAEKEIYDLLREIKSKRNISIMLISHNLEVLKNFCDRILFIDGEIKFEVIPNKKAESLDEDYFEHIMEYLND